METKLNIAKILKDKPQGTKLYSSACGKCELKQVDDNSFKISFYNSKFGFMNGGEGHLDKFGKLYDDGECVIFPSKEMRDWSKFAWKKGDVLVNDNGNKEIIFKDWFNDSYTKFYGEHYLNYEDRYDIKYLKKIICCTNGYSIEGNGASQCYIKTIEKRLGGKLNLETLEIEKTQPEFKDGDILFSYNTTSIFIFSGFGKYKGFNYYVALAYQGLVFSAGGAWCYPGAQVRYATEKEKQQLFDALAKEGKAWDAEKKQIVDLKPKWTPKPFDRVITRTPDTPWTANFFSHIDSDGIKNCIDDRYLMCLPYNEETAKLIGTTNTIEGY